MVTPNTPSCAQELVYRSCGRLGRISWAVGTITAILFTAGIFSAGAYRTLHTARSGEPYLGELLMTVGLTAFCGSMVLLFIRRVQIVSIRADSIVLTTVGNVWRLGVEDIACIRGWLAVPLRAWWQGVLLIVVRTPWTKIPLFIVTAPAFPFADGCGTRKFYNLVERIETMVKSTRVKRRGA